MTFYEYWQEKQGQDAATLQRLIEQSQMWVGRRVWVAPTPGVTGSAAPSTYGEIEGIDERGRVKIVVGRSPSNTPLYHFTDVFSLGNLVTLANE